MRGRVDSVTDDAAAQTLLRFLEDVGDAPEVMWAAALAMIDHTLTAAREGQHNRFRSHPHGHLRHLRRDLAQAMKLARFAVALQEAEAEHTLAIELHARAIQQAAQAAAIARKAKRDARSEVPLTNEASTPEWQERRRLELQAEREASRRRVRAARARAKRAQQRTDG